MDADFRRRRVLSVRAHDLLLGFGHAQAGRRAHLHHHLHHIY